MDKIPAQSRSAIAYGSYNKEQAKYGTEQNRVKTNRRNSAVAIYPFQNWSVATEEEQGSYKERQRV